MTDAAFAALGDPTRRRVLEAVASGRAATATALARELPVSRQAVSKHLGALHEAELVEVERVGREARYTFRPEPLAEVAGWIAEVGGEWDNRLADLDRLLAKRR